MKAEKDRKSTGFPNEAGDSSTGLSAPKRFLKSRTMNRIIHIWFAVSAMTLISVVRGADVVSIWGGAQGTLILKSDGTVWT
jgi:hypothetical protein